MLKKELIKALEKVKDDEDINSIVLGIDDFKQKDYSNLSLDEFKEFLDENKILKGYVESSLNTKATESVEEWKKKNLKKIIEDKIKEHDQEGLSDEQKENLKLKAEIEKMKAEQEVSKLKADYSKVLADKKINNKLIDYLPYSSGKEAIDGMINVLEESFSDFKNEEYKNANTGLEKGEGLGGTGLSGVEQAFYERNPGLLK